MKETLPSKTSLRWYHFGVHRNKICRGWLHKRLHKYPFVKIDCFQFRSGAWISNFRLQTNTNEITIWIGLFSGKFLTWVKLSYSQRAIDCTHLPATSHGVWCWCRFKAVSIYFSIESNARWCTWIGHSLCTSSKIIWNCLRGPEKCGRYKMYTHFTTFYDVSVWVWSRYTRICPLFVQAFLGHHSRVAVRFIYSFISNIQ